MVPGHPITAKWAARLGGPCQAQRVRDVNRAGCRLPNPIPPIYTKFRMNTAGVLALLGFFLPVVIGGLAQLEKIIGPRVLEWLRSRLGPNARVS